jgi:hypothetical protein
VTVAVGPVATLDVKNIVKEVVLEDAKVGAHLVLDIN